MKTKMDFKVKIHIAIIFMSQEWNKKNKSYNIKIK